MLLLLAAVAAACAADSITVAPTYRSTWSVPSYFSSLGIEYLNHEIYGGLYSQLIFGESFEEQSFSVAGAPRVISTSVGDIPSFAWLQSTVNPDLYIRHCDYVLWQTPQIAPMQDFVWHVVAALNGESGAVSFQSTNYPTYFLSISPQSGLEPGRLGIVPQVATQAYNDSSSFKVVPGLADSSLYSFVAYGEFEGYYIAADQSQIGGCSWQGQPYNDVVMAQSPNAAAATWNISIPYNPQPLEQQGYIGCGNGRSNDSMLLSNISFMWMGLTTGTAQPQYTLVSDGDAFNGDQYQNMQFVSGTGRVGLANYGLDCQLGLFLIRGNEYIGHIYVRSQQAVTFTVSVEDYETNTILDEVDVTLNTQGQWERFNFTLTPSQNTTCSAANQTIQGSTQTIYSCSGRFVVSLMNPGDSLDVDLTYLSPASWGLIPAPTAGSIGLPARLDIAQTLAGQFIKTIRMGGSMCNAEGYRWKFFRGDRDYRQPYQGIWYQEPGLTQSRGFGMFEIADLCSSIGCYPVVTIDNLELASDMGDFVEYCWGDETTLWGQIRIQDGHPEPYNITHIEIGNEQALTLQLLEQIVNISSTMEQRVAALGLNVSFKYIIGENLDSSQFSGSSMQIVQQFIEQTMFLGDRIFWDLHVGAEPDSVPYWEAMVEQFQGIVDSMGSLLRFVILEENGGDHGLLRGMGHATYSNMMHRHADFGSLHGYANCLEAFQGMDVEQMFPQGQIFTLPNMTWGQPTYYVIQMVENSYQPYNLPLNTSLSPSVSLDAVALGNDDASEVVIRVVNWGAPTNISIVLQDVIAPASVDIAVLQGVTGGDYEQNTPMNPTLISPQQYEAAYTPDTQYYLATNSFTIFSFAGIVAAK